MRHSELVSRSCLPDPAHSPLLSWLVNLVDGMVIIIAHVAFKDAGYPFPQFYHHIFNFKYIYIVWLLEVRVRCERGGVGGAYYCLHVF